MLPTSLALKVEEQQPQQLCSSDTRQRSPTPVGAPLKSNGTADKMDPNPVGKPPDSEPPAHDFQSLVDFHRMLGSPSDSHEAPRAELPQLQLPTLQISPPSSSIAAATLTGNNVCQVCHKEFQRWEQLKRHLITHTDFRPYECKVCGRRFQLQNKMQRHELTHSGVKPHQCPLCSVKVSRKEHLRRHMLVHSEAKPYKCSLCDHTARRMDSIQGHVKQKHGEAGATVVSLFKDPDYLESIEALSRSLEQGIQPPMPAVSAMAAVQPGNHKPKKKGSKKRKRSNPMQVENCTQTDQKAGKNGTNKDNAHRANTMVFPEFIINDGSKQLNQDKLVSNGETGAKSNNVTDDKDLDKNTQDKAEDYMMQPFKNGNHGSEDVAIKVEPSTGGATSCSELPWQQMQQPGFVASGSQSLAYPSQIFPGQALYAGQTPLRPAQPLLPGNQAVSQPYWPEQRFATPIYQASQPAFSTHMAPSAESGSLSVQSAYFNAGFSPYPAVAMNPNANIPVCSPSHLIGQNVPEFFRKRIRQGTQELNKMAEEINSSK